MRFIGALADGESDVQLILLLRRGDWILLIAVHTERRRRVPAAAVYGSPRAGSWEGPWNHGPPELKRCAKASRLGLHAATDDLPLPEHWHVWTRRGLPAGGAYDTIKNAAVETTAANRSGVMQLANRLSSRTDL